MPCSSLLGRRVLVALLAAGACVPVGGSLAGVAEATPAVRPTAGAADPQGPRASAAKPTSATTVGVRRYTVRSGDCLSRIAARYRYPGGWPRLYAHNRRTVGQDPDLIHPGQTLRLVLRQPAQSPPPAPRRGAVTVAKAPAGTAAQPVEPATPPGGPKAVPEPAQPAPSRWQAALAWVAPALGILFAFGLVLAAVAGDPQPERRHRRPVAPNPPVPDLTPAPDPSPAPQPTPTPTSHTPARPGPTTAGDDPVTFSLVVVAAGDLDADLIAPLAQLAALDDWRLGIVVVVGQDDRIARAVAEAAHRRLPDRITVVTDPHRPTSVAASIDRALPACHGEVTGVLGAGPIRQELLDRVAGHVRHDGASMVWAGTQSPACRWSTSRPPGRFRLRLVPLSGQHVFVRTELLHPQTAQDAEPATGPSQPDAGIHGQPADARRRRATLQLDTTGRRVTPDNQPPVMEPTRRSGAM